MEKGLKTCKPILAINKSLSTIHSFISRKKNRFLVSPGARTQFIFLPDNILVLPVKEREKKNNPYKVLRLTKKRKPKVPWSFRVLQWTDIGDSCQGSFFVQSSIHRRISIVALLTDIGRVINAQQRFFSGGYKTRSRSNIVVSIRVPSASKYYIQNRYTRSWWRIQKATTLTRPKSRIKFHEYLAFKAMNWGALRNGIVIWTYLIFFSISVIDFKVNRPTFLKDFTIYSCSNKRPFRTSYLKIYRIVELL